MKEHLRDIYQPLLKISQPLDYQPRKYFLGSLHIVNFFILSKHVSIIQVIVLCLSSACSCLVNDKIQLAKNKVMFLADIYNILF